MFIEILHFDNQRKFYLVKEINLDLNAKTNKYSIYNKPKTNFKKKLYLYSTRERNQIEEDNNIIDKIDNDR